MSPSRPARQRNLANFPASSSRIVPKAEALGSNPRPPGCKKLQAGDREWRIRVGDYRVVYTIDDARLMVEITRIRHRREVYH